MSRVDMAFAAAMALLLGLVVYCWVQIARCDTACSALGYGKSAAYFDGSCGCDSHARTVSP